MFMDLFNVDKLLQSEKKKPRQTGLYDTSQYDDVTNRTTKLNPGDAAHLILRTDDNVDYQATWGVLRDMIACDEYKERVLEFVNKAKTVPS